jgi:pimeloyl-ACP methyl ester carboxylesterase
MKETIIRWTWFFWVGVFRLAGLIFYLSPSCLPKNERRKLSRASLPYDVIIIFNSGGWGDTPLEEANDFMPTLDGMEEVIRGLGYSSTVVPYVRTLSSLAGRLAGIKEQFNSFKNSSRILADDIKYLAEQFPEKRFIVTGFSTGGGVTSRAMESLSSLANVYGISVGVPAWFYIYRSNKSLVLDNSGCDPLCTGNPNSIAMAVFRAPAKWVRARRNGQRLSAALAIQIEHHEYSWFSPEVGIPISGYLQAVLRDK